MAISADYVPAGHVNGHPTAHNGQINGSSLKNEITQVYIDEFSTSGQSSDDELVKISNRTQTASIKPTDGIVNGATTNGLVDPQDQIDAPIAICGMACRLPGGLHTPQQLWEFLLAKGDARSRVPESRYNISAFYDPSGKPGTIKTEHGYFLDLDLSKADSNFSSLVRSALERYDPHQLLMTEVAREAIEDAGATNLKGDLVGCYIGSFGEDWGEMYAKDIQQYGLYRVAGIGDYMLANHVSYEMDFRGPSMTLRTGCSAALVGLHEACRAIQRGDCTSAIVGGANLILAPGMTQAMTEQGVLSPDGSCKTFSADADGYARGEAISAIYIKPLAAALRDGNPVRAVIKATATNSDGRTPGISYPSTEAHEAMMRKVHKFAGLTDFSKTTFVECHGTGTPTGDPIEANAVARVFGGTEHGVYIGSIKPNLGHAEGAAGLSSLIKMVLSLENRIIPPNIKFTSPNPNIPFKSRNLKVAVDPTPWPEHGEERGLVNAFGIGGANATVLLESAHSHGIQTQTVSHFGTSESDDDVAADAQLLLYSANSPTSLQKVMEAYQTWIEANPRKLNNLAYTLANGREHLSHRAYTIVSSDRQPVVSSTVKLQKSKPSDVVMVFTGQGAQWPTMGLELMQSNATFQASIRALDKELKDALGTNIEWTIEDELLKPQKKSRVALAELSQPLCTALQIAFVDVLTSVGIKPVAVVGHSSGEIAAAYAAGVVTAREGILIAYFRGLVTTKQKRSGSMAAIGMGWEDVKPYLVDSVTVACENSPNSVTISGDTDKVKAVVEHIKDSPPNGQEVLARLLKVEKAYHSYHMVEVGEEYHSLLTGAGVKSGNAIDCAFYSSVTGQLLQEGDSLSPRYWQQNLESTVLFSTAVSNILRNLDTTDHDTIFLEVGPHSAMAGPLRQIAAQASAALPYVTAMVRNQNCTESYLGAIGKLHQMNVPIDLEALVPKGDMTHLPDLPRYAWDHQESYWYESRLSKEWRHRKFPYHDLLGLRVGESTDLEPSWRNMFHLDNAPWIRDHMIIDDIVFPCAGYIAMAGEAIRQTSGVQEGYRLRNLIVSTALVLTEGKPVELLTTFRPHRLTDALDSQWWEFAIMSHNGQNWTKHCTGQIRSLEEKAKSFQAPISLPRDVDTRKAYKSMHEAGLNYGPHFQGLDKIQSGTIQHTAIAEVVTGRQGDENRYHIHPVIIDACLQLLSVAATKGYTKKHGMVVPTNIGSLSVHRCTSDVNVFVSADINKLGAIFGTAHCTVDGEAVLSMGGARLSPLPGEEVASTGYPHATARYEWAQHIDFVDEKTLIQPSTGFASSMLLLHELFLYCLVASHRRLATLHIELEHMQKYKAWVDGQLQLLLSENEVSDICKLEDSAIFKRAIELFQSLSNTPAAAPASAMYTILTGLTAIASGRTNGLKALLDDDTLNKVYAFRDNDICAKVRLILNLAHTKPNLRILELGAGTGANTSTLLKDLVLPDGRVMYSSYVFSDPSSGMVTAAKKRFAEFPNVQFKTLDIAKNLAEQDFDGNQYDLIIATNIFHSTPDLTASLERARTLLHAANGRLLLQELSPASQWLNLILGILPSFRFDLNQGCNEMYLDVPQWQSKLNAVGMYISATIADSKEQTFQLNNVIVARPTLPDVGPKEVVLLCPQTTATVPEEMISQALTEIGYIVRRQCVREAIVKGVDVIAMLDQDKSFFQDIDAPSFETYKSLVTNSTESGTSIFWVTQLSQMQCSDPMYAQVLGTARTIRAEASVDFATCEVDDISSARSANLVADVFAKFQSQRARKQDDDTADNPDYEYVIVDNTVNVGRFYPFSLADELLSTDANDRIVLETEKPGLLTALKWKRRASQPLKNDQVEVQTYAAGLNFKDVLGANGITEVPEQGFGLEAAGIISNLGPDVKDLRVGDRVILFSRGCFSSSVIVSEKLCEKIPDSLSFEDAATMACVYATAIYSLFDIGRLEKGRSVLIHSACGGVGLAAIQLARMVDADIYVTVGNDDKVKYLMDTFKIPRDRIFNSRNTTFVEDVLNATDGKGVDVALNSLSGELLHATWRCIAEFGTMVEIGKRDLLEKGKLDMDVFLANRSYCCVDLDQLCLKKPSVCKKLLKSVIETFASGHILPIKPIKIFDASSMREAFRYMQQGLHMGKIVLSFREDTDELKIDTAEATRRTAVELDESASYLLIGGLGGIGRSVSRWLVEHGARRLVYLSRSAVVNEDNQQFIHEIESMGCEVKLVQGSVVNLEDVQKAIAASPNLKGILQMSMVLRDQGWDRMTLEEWNEASSPKIQGTWNLHNATKDTKLDFFVLFSSISGIIGQPGQANYAAANTFLDAFAQYRSSLGLAVSSIDIGAVDDIGVISNNEGLRRAMKATGAYMIKEAELVEAIGAAITIPQTQHATSNNSNDLRENVNLATTSNKNNFVLGLASTISLDSPQNRAIWKQDMRMAAYRNVNTGSDAGGSGGSASDTLKSFLADARHDASLLKSADTANFLAREIGKKLFVLVLRPEEEINTSVGLADLGMDSLVAIEMRSWWRATFGSNISVLELLGMGSLDALGAHAAEGLLKTIHE